jgi:hypothetical protein
MKGHRFTIKTAVGKILVGQIQDCGRLVPRQGGYGILRLAIASAEESVVTGIYEPRPGYARIYPDSVTAIDFPLAGAEVLT